MEAVKHLNNPETETEILSAKEELSLMEAELRKINYEFFENGQRLLKKHRNQEKPSKDEMQSHQETRKIINNMERAFAILLKMVYPKGMKQGNEADNGNPDIAKVKEMKGSMGEIVRKID